MEIYESSEITVHKLNELREDDSKIQIVDVREIVTSILMVSDLSRQKE